MGTPETLKARIAEESKQALKAGEKVRLGTLRMLSAAVKNREVELRRELTDDEVTEVAIKEAKPKLALTHLPGHMFLTDMRDEDIIRS